MNKCISEFTFAFLRSLLRSRREAPLRVRSEGRSSRIRSFKEKSPLVPPPSPSRRKNNLYERRSLRPPFPTFALGLIKDFSLSLSLSLFFHIPRNCRGMQEDDLREEEFRFLLETRFLPPDPSNLPRCLGQE